MSSEAYIFIGGCRFYVGGFKLVHPLSASCFGGSVRAIGGSFPSKLPLCSGLESQLSDFMLPVHPNPNRQLRSQKMSQGGPAISGTTLNLPHSSQSQLLATIASLPTSCLCCCGPPQLQQHCPAHTHVKPRAHKMKKSACVPSLSARMRSFLVCAACVPSLPVCAHAHGDNIPT